MILNSSLLGEELCADLIVQAARAKLTSRQDGDAKGAGRLNGID
jgi:hypothetical protein